MNKRYFALLVCLVAGCQTSATKMDAALSTNAAPTAKVRRVIILCTGNSCRSQMAEGFWKKYGGSGWEVVSAGTHPKDRVYPMAVKAMAEKGIDIGGHKPKDVKAFTDQRFDLVITVCGDAERECPHFANAMEHLHWPFDDPPKATGSDEQKMEVCRRVRDEIEAKVRQYLSSSGKDSR